jgi:hypothetical protein
VGQQQLLLIVLAMILVGIAVIFAITLFRQKAVDSKRDLLVNEGGNIATDALLYYKKPSAFGGGGNSFYGWAIPQSIVTTATGNYVATIFRDSVIIIGTGNDVTNGTDSVKIQFSVYQDTYRTQIIN